MTELAGTLWVAGGGALGAYCRFQISAWFADGNPQEQRVSTCAERAGLETAE